MEFWSLALFSPTHVVPCIEKQDDVLMLRGYSMQLYSNLIQRLLKLCTFSEKLSLVQKDTHAFFF